MELFLSVMGIISTIGIAVSLLLTRSAIKKMNMVNSFNIWYTALLLLSIILFAIAGIDIFELGYKTGIDSLK